MILSTVACEGERTSNSPNSEMITGFLFALDGKIMKAIHHTAESKPAYTLFSEGKCISQPPLPYRPIFHTPICPKLLNISSSNTICIQCLPFQSLGYHENQHAPLGLSLFLITQRKAGAYRSGGLKKSEGRRR